MTIRVKDGSSPQWVLVQAKVKSFTFTLSSGSFSICLSESAIHGAISDMVEKEIKIFLRAFHTLSGAVFFPVAKEALHSLGNWCAVLFPRKAT